MRLSQMTIVVSIPRELWDATPDDVLEAWAHNAQCILEDAEDAVRSRLGSQFTVEVE